jgi:ABC-type transporter Mla subunit MlaD
MRRLLTILFLLGVCAAAFVLSGASDDSSGRTYRIVFDNAFGLVKDGDFRVGGVTAGKTTDLEVERIKKGSYKAVSARTPAARSGRSR